MMLISNIIKFLLGKTLVIQKITNIIKNIYFFALFGTYFISYYPCHSKKYCDYFIHKSLFLMKLNSRKKIF